MPDCSAGPIRSQAFYKNIDWDRLELKQIDPPFKPKIVSFLNFKIIILYTSLRVEIGLQLI